MPAMPLALASLALGAIIGLIWTVIHPPIRLTSAMEADRQLESADLLGSALLVAAKSRDPWSEAVMAEADRWCAMHSSSTVLLNRLGARAWGGIGLATALLLVLALLPVATTSNVAGQSGVSLFADEGPSLGSQLGQGSPRTPMQQKEPEDLHPSQITAPVEDAQNQEQQTSASSRRRPGSDAAAGRGGGESHSESRNQRGPTAAQTTGGGVDKSNSGRVAAGAGSASGGNGSASESGTDASPANNLPGVPPWRSDHWSSDVNRANQAVESGQIPDQYRDMIRGYFDRAKDR
jgi:hypothetical protein